MHCNKNIKIMETYNQRTKRYTNKTTAMAYHQFNFSQYLREHPFETWNITKTINSPKVIEKVISPRIIYGDLYFHNFQVFNPENCLDFLVEVFRQFPRNWDIREIHFIEEDITERGYPDLYTIYKIETIGVTQPVNLDFLKKLYMGDSIFSYYDNDSFLNIVIVTKA